MQEQLKCKIGRKVLFTTGLAMLLEIIFPTVSFALTSGPAQPEFSSFEPVATTNMVNEFTGDMMYNLPVLNIPGANGGGYALSLSYHSGASPEEEASWVGYGWTLNPGSINRGKRGLPDDYKGSNVNYWNKTKPNRTVSLGGSLSLEGFSADLKDLLGASANASLRYNNYKGFGTSKGVGLTIAKGLVSLGYGISDGDGSFSARINPMAILSLREKEKTKVKEPLTMSELKTGIKKIKKGLGEKGDKTKFKLSKAGGIGALALAGSNYGVFSHNSEVRASNITKYKGESTNVSFGFIPTGLPLQLGPNAEVSGNFTWQQNVNSSDQVNSADALSAYGYMYLASASAGNSLMDYYTEKDNPYDKRDYYLGLPFSNADNFAISGEGIGGGFRLYNKTAGHYTQRNITSKLNIINVGGEVEGGLDLGGGAKLGAGFQRFISKGWNLNGGFSDSASADEPYFFRFNNDMGGYFDFGNDGLQRASINTDNGIPGVKAFSASISGINTVSNGSERSGRSSYIAYHTNKEMSYTKNSKRYKAYTLSHDVDSLITRSSVPDGLGELIVFNEDGTRYNYGLPVYSRKESNLQYDLIGVTAGNIKDNYIAYRDISDKNQIQTIVGEESPAPYASTFLLTEITSADYVDRTFDGPTDDDFGGYTRFSYDRKHGSKDKNNSTSWYKWRIPYNGLLYNKGELSTQDDDMGSVVYGEKEIYYLDSILTKTHYAVFETSDRTDGMEAAAYNTAANSSTAKGSKKLQKLNKIKLYSKNIGVAQGPKLIQTVNFEYYGDTDANTVCKGLPNSSTTGGGKLTLKRVWIEYEGTAGARISPYIFEYKYPGDNVYPTEYASMDNYGTGKKENPGYSPFCIDAWGNYQDSADAKSRYSNMKNWLNQNPPTTFDPAAWQLKVIKLPTGGEIHIQYEQDEYAYVQDKRVEAMISLKTSSNDATNAAKYYLNTDDFGPGLDTQQKQKMRDLIQENYVKPEKKIYFKFLYGLIGPNVSISSCQSEYITGYCNVKEVNIDGGELYVILGKTGSKFDLPKKVCWDYVKKERIGNLNKSGNCDPSTSGVNTDGNAKKVVEQLVNFVSAGGGIIPQNDELCQDVNFPLSYLRVPMPTAKKGGGIRVKRLLMYDKGIETGDKSLFGNEYEYKLTDGTTSGVAINEPASIREENVLIESDPRLKQKFLDKVISGRDRDQSEKPLGESVLPSPSVGYERIIVKNIHSGKTNTGFTVKEFYTAREFPMQVDYTDIKQEKDWLVIPGGFINYNVNNVWMSQGFQIKLNAMHGQIKREATYGGDVADFTKSMLSSEQLYEYYKPGDLIPVMTSFNSVSYQPLGKETELVFETRGMEDKTHDIAAEFDLSVGFAGIIPIFQFSLIPSYSYSESQMYSHVTNKIIQYPAIQKKVTTKADGIEHITENLAFNLHTGKPVITRTSDGFNKLNLEQSTNHEGSYMAFNYPASLQYPAMGQKASNERARIVSNSAKLKIEKFVSGNLAYLELTDTSSNYVDTCFGNFAYNAKSSFPAGSLVKLSLKGSPGTDLGIYHISDSINGNRLYLYPASQFGANNTNTGEVVAEILRSGNTNQLSTTIGSVTSYGYSNTSQLSGNRYQLLAQRMDSVLQTLSPSNNNIFLPTSLIPDSINITWACNKNECSSELYHNNTWNYGGFNFLMNTQGQTPTVSIFLWPIVSDSSIVGCKQCWVTDDCNGDGTITTQDLLCFLNEFYENGGNYPDLIPTFPISSTSNPGHVGICATTGNLYWYPSSPTPANCGANLMINFCDKDLKSSVVAASAQTFDDNWPYDTLVYNKAASTNSYENGMKGKWRLESNYVYRDSIVGANGTGQRNYKDAGVFTMDLFNWQDPTANDTDKWIKINTVTAYAPDGNALEEKDILGIHSAAKFGYDKTQPYMVAKNADYQSIQFESFEKSYKSQTELEDGWAVSNISTKLVGGIAHAGNSSWKLTNADSIGLKNIKITQQMLDNGLSLKVWVRDTARTEEISVKARLKETGGASVSYTMTKIAQTGEWALYEQKITNLSTNFSLNDVVTPYIRNKYTSKTIWLDDVRLQPLDAQVISYVYDINTLRLIASFDDQHFALFYQYNGEGKLVRKLIETEKGIKTITETQYHTVQQPR